MAGGRSFGAELATWSPDPNRAASNGSSGWRAKVDCHNVGRALLRDIDTGYARSGAGPARPRPGISSIDINLNGRRLEGAGHGSEG